MSSKDSPATSPTVAADVETGSGGPEVTLGKTAPADAAPKMTFFRWMAVQFVRRNCLVLCCCIAFLLVTYALTGGMGLADQTPQSDADFDIKREQDVKNFQALEQAQSTLGSELAGQQARQSQDDFSFDLFLLAHATGSEPNMLSTNRIVVEQSLQRRVLNMDGYDEICLKNVETDRCYPPQSIFQLPSGLAIELEPIPVWLAGRQINATMTAAQRDDVLFSWANATDTGTSLIRNLFLGSDFTPENLRAEYTRSYFPMGLPLEGFQNAEDDRDGQTSVMASVLSDIGREVNDERGDKDGVEAVLFSGPVFQNAFAETVVSDTMWASASMVFVAIYIGIHTRSAFMGLTGILQISSSLPVALVVYKLVLGIDFLQTLHFLVVWVILGIGADNIFLQADAFAQFPGRRSHSEGDMINRVEFMYKRALEAMTITSLTTAAAFMATFISSPIIPIRLFGAWATIVVLMNLLLNFFLVPALIVFWELNVRNFEMHYLCCCLWDQEAKDEHRVHKDGGASHGPRTPVPEEPVVEAALQGASAAGVVKDNPAATIPAMIPAHSAAPNASVEVVPAVDCHAACGCSCADDHGIEEEDGNQAEHLHLSRCQEKFMWYAWAPAIYHLRVYIIALFLALFALALYGTTTLEPLTEQEQWFPKDHWVSRSLAWQSDHFGTSGRSQTVSIQLVWGIDDIDRSGTDPFVPSDFGVPDYDADFDVSSTEAQQYLADLCDYFDPVTRPDTPSPSAAAEPAAEWVRAVERCWVRDFRTWLNSTGEAFPYLSANVSAAAVAEQAAVRKATFEDKLREWVTVDYFGQTARAEAYVGLSNAHGLRFIVIRVSTLLQEWQPFDTNKPVYDIFTELMTSIDAEGIANGYQTAEGWTWMRTERAFVRQAVQGIAIAAAVALVVLVVATNNWIVGTVATLSIFGIVVCVLGSVAAFGWQFGTTESIASVIIMGLSVDYMAHLSTGFTEADAGLKTRFKRMRHSLTEMGISVIAGAVTSFGAGIFLLPTTIIFFYKFSILLMVVISYSLCWALLFLPSVLMVAGPLGEAGNFRALFVCCCPQGQGKASGGKGTALQR